MTASTGNGSPQHDDVPFPRRPPQPVERIKRAADEAERKLPEPPGNRAPAPPPAEPIHDFMARIDNAAGMLAEVGAELGHVGQDDAQALRFFAESMRDNARRYVGSLVERKRRELADLERILGKL